MVADWPAWPIFITQLITLGLFLFPRNLRMLGCSPRKIIIALLLLIAIAILASLYHDSTSKLPLYF